MKKNKRQLISPSPKNTRPPCHCYHVLTLLFFSLSACQEAPPPPPAAPKKPTVLTVLYSSEIESILNIVRGRYLASNPETTDGSPIEVNLISEPSIVSAEALSTGVRKVSAWISPSQRLVDSVNNNLKNLGAKQGECQPLFYTPVVVAARAKSTGVTTRLDSLSEALSAYASEGTRLEWSLPRTKLNEAGLQGIAMLATELSLDAYLTKQSTTTSTDSAIQDLEISPEEKRINYLAHSLFAKRSDSLANLELLGNGEDNRVRLAVTTEREVATFNLMDNTSTPIKAFYANKNLRVLEYQLCTSQKEWVREEHKQALSDFLKAFASEQTEIDILNLGFRPLKPVAPKVEDKPLAPGVHNKLLSPSFGVREEIQLPKGSNKIPFNNDWMQAWDNIKPKRAIAIVVDTSAIMKKESLAIISREAESFTSSLDENDSVAVFFTGSKTDYTPTFSTDKRTAIRSLANVAPEGPNRLFDAMSEAISALDQIQEQQPTIKELVVIADSKDGGSSVPLTALFLSFAVISERTPISVTLMGIGTESSLVDTLKEIQRTLSAQIYISTDAGLLGNSRILFRTLG